MLHAIDLLDPIDGAHEAEDSTSRLGKIWSAEQVIDCGIVD